MAARTRMAEFYQHAMYNFPELATGAYRQVLKTFLTATTKNISKLGVRVEPATPSLMLRQMNEIGWMHNRCRMIVANFLTKTY